MEDNIRQIVEYAKPVATSMTDIEKYSSQDREITKVKEGIFNNIWDPTVNNFKIFQSELCFYGNILLRGTKLEIPEKLRGNILAAAHEGHPGIGRMKSRLRTKVWWPKIDIDAEKIVKNCKGCTLVSVPNPPIPMKRRELPTAAWMDVAIDFMGPLPSGDYLLVVIDYYSRYKEVKIMKTITSATTIQVLEEIFARFGFPISITADNGKQFVSGDFKIFCEVNGIRLYNTIPYWPQQNGEVERQNRSILKRLKISQASRRNWKKDLLEYLMMYNSTPHSTTGKTPSELFFGRVFRDKLPCLQDFSKKYIHDEVRERDMIEKERGKQYADNKRRATENELKCGDKVLVKKMVKENKLCPNFDSTLHTVVKEKGGDIEVQNDETGKQYRKNIVHLKKVGENWTICNQENEISGPSKDDKVNIEKNQVQ